MSTELIETLWEQYHTRLLAFIRSRVADPAEADDLLQEVFVRVHQQLCCSTSYQRPDAWFYQIARNLIIDNYRRQRSQVNLEDSDSLLAVELPPLWEEDAEERLASSLRQTIDTLPALYRSALIAVEFDGLSQQQLAQQAGLSLSGAKSRVQRARQMLRDVLVACCHFEFDRRGQLIDYYPRCCCCNPGQ